MPSNYESLGLNNLLSPLNSPIKFGEANPINFDANTDRTSITNSKIRNITADKISAGTIDSDIIYGGTITAGQISAGTLNSGVINSGTLSASKITGGTMSANLLTAGTINASSIAVINIDADKINTGELNVTSVPIKNLDGVTDGGGVTVINGGKITTGTIDASVVDVENLNASNINAGTLTGRTVRTASSGQRVLMDGSNNRLDFINSGGTTVGRITGTSGGMTLENPDSSTQISFGLTDLLLFATSGNYVTTAGGSGLDLNGRRLRNISELEFDDNSSTPGDREFLMDDDGSNQRLRVKFANNGTQWQLDLSAVCQPVSRYNYDSKYDKYDLMKELDDTRFKKRYPFTQDIQKEYRAKPIWHYPSMGHEGDEWNEHTEAMWKRPWLPMRTMPDRLETMGQYPYPFVESPLIGEGEPKANFYQLIAHAYNHQQDRIDLLSDRIEVLEDMLGV